jgi:transposase-like protein
MAHGQWTEVEGRAVIAAWRKSGLSTVEYAREHGIVPQRLYWWRHKLEGGGTKDEVKLLPVQVAEPRRGEPITVLLRTGHMLKVGRGFDEEALLRVVAVLEAG